MVSDINEARMWESVLHNTSSQPEDVMRARAEVRSRILDAIDLASASSTRRGNWVTLEEINLVIPNTGLGNPVTTYQLNKYVDEGYLERRYPVSYKYRMYRLARKAYDG